MAGVRAVAERVAATLRANPDTRVVNFDWNEMTKSMRIVVDQEKARQLGIENVRFNAAGCLDRCEFGPNLVIYPEGVWYRYESQEDIDEILQTHLVEGGRVTRLMLQPEQLPPKH